MRRHPDVDESTAARPPARPAGAGAPRSTDGRHPGGATGRHPGRTAAPGRRSDAADPRRPGTTAAPGRRSDVPGSAPRRPASRPPEPALRLTARGRAVVRTGALAVLVLVVAGVVALVRPDGGAVTAAPTAPVVSCTPDATTSQNCWPAFDRGDDPQLEVSQWVTGRLLGGDVRTVLEHVAARFDAQVEPVDVDSSWGWAYRSVRGEVGDAESLSNHASGTSIDLNATEHPLGETGTFTADQVTAIRGILAEVAPVVAWGGDFDRPDEMHFEIVGDADAVAEVAARLRGEQPAG